jgi:hypothetical protein
MNNPDVTVRVTAARQANLDRQARRLQLTRHLRLRQFAASMRLINIRRLGTTRPAAAPKVDQGQ